MTKPNACPRGLFRLIWSAAMALAVLPWSAAVGRGDEGGTQVPLKKVVMFNSGVGFFERSAEVEGDARVDLKFNVDDINDLLKSMVLQDLGGGQVSAVSYGSKDPITRTLQTFAIDLTTNPTMAALLSQVRGEKVQIDAPNPIVGTIVGVERRKQRVGEREIAESDFLNLLTDDGLRSVSLENVGRIKLVNEKLDAELRQALMVLAMGHATDKKTVTLNFLGKGKRPVRVGYIQEAPIWKTSYRLVLNNEEAPFLQGWAIVENTTEEDWKEVSLTLVSGRPISFVMDLYQPLYVSRPLVEPELYASLRPQTYGQDLAAKEQEFRRMADAKGAPPAPPALAAAAPGFGGANQARQRSFADRDAAVMEERKSLRLDQGVQSVAQAEDVGELFQYTIATPVNITRQQSAMLPIVNGSVQGEKVSIYNRNVHVKHPLNGLKMTNTTGLHLMQGPITVFDDGAYAGDAQIQDLQPNTTRLISYAMDLDTEVAPESKPQPESLVSCSLVKGLVHTTHKHTRSQQFTVKNSGRRAKKVLIEYPLESIWTLVSPKEPEEKTRDMYRFAVQAEPGKPTVLAVNEERIVRNQVSLNNVDDNTIRLYMNSTVASEKVKQAFADVLKRKKEILDLANQRRLLEQQITVIDQEQARIRQNMAQLSKGTDLYNRYIKKFTEQEDQVEALRAQIQALITQEAQLRKALDEMLANLTLA